MATTGAGETSTVAWAWSRTASSVGEEEGELRQTQTGLYPRPLTSMLTSSHLSKSEKSQEKEKELEGSSVFVAVNHSLNAVNRSLYAIAASEHRDTATPAVRPWASADERMMKKSESKTGVAAARVSSVSIPNNQDDSRELLQDLFPAGFTSRVLSPTEGGPNFGQNLVPGLAPTGSLDGLEPELQGSQTWTCLVPTTPTRDGPAECGEANLPHQRPAVRAFPAASGSQAPQAQREMPAAGTGTPLAPSTLTFSKSLSDVVSAAVDKCPDSATAVNTPVPSTVSTAQPMFVGVVSQNAAAAATAEHGSLQGLDEGNANSRAGTAPVARVTVQEREEDLKLALDRLVAQVHDRDERVKYLESRLQEAMRGESGRNALIKKVAKLEGEVKHLSERLDMRQAEALKWRDERQALEAETSRLNAELHRALDRCSRFESDGRRKDSLLAEARASKDDLAKANASFEIELRQKDQLLRDAETDRKRAWQTTNASAEAATVAVRRAEVVEMEAESLRREVQRRDSNAENPNVVSDRRHSTPSVRLGSISESDPSWTNRRLSLEAPMLGGRANGGMMERDRSRGRSFSPEKVDRAATDRDAVGASGTHGRRALDRDSYSHFIHHAAQPLAPPPPPPPGADSIPFKDTAIDCLIETDTRQAGRRSSADSNGVRDALTGPHPEWGEFPRTRHEAPSTLAIRASGGREQCESGDRERHDSNGVRAALTAATPEWGVNIGGGRSQERHSAAGGRRRSEGDRYRPENLDRGGADEQGDREGSGGTPEFGLDSTRRLRSGMGWNDRGREWNGNGMSTGGSPIDQGFPAAGQQRGRDEMSSRRCSLSGAGAGIQGHTMYDESRRSSDSSVRVAAWQQLQPAPSRRQEASGSGDGPPSGGQLTAIKETGGTERGVGLSVGSLPATLSLADMIGGREPVVEAPDGEREEFRRRDRALAPFATDVADEELRPQRELEHQLMVLQMEASQLEAEQTRLLPKATKTIQGRVRMRDIESRLEWLAKEASGVRTAIRQKSRRT